MTRVVCRCAVVWISARDHSRLCKNCQAVQTTHEIEASINKLPGEYVAVETPGTNQQIYILAIRGAFRSGRECSGCSRRVLVLACRTEFGAESLWLCGVRRRSNGFDGDGCRRVHRGVDSFILRHSLPHPHNRRDAARAVCVPFPYMYA